MVIYLILSCALRWLTVPHRENFGENLKATAQDEAIELATNSQLEQQQALNIITT